MVASSIPNWLRWGIPSVIAVIAAILFAIAGVLSLRAALESWANACHRVALEPYTMPQRAPWPIGPCFQRHVRDGAHRR